jgi:hypothetical protein
VRPLGTYTEITRNPAQVADTARASGPGSCPTGLEGSSRSPATTSSKPTREAIATPFQRPSPWWATAYPRSVSAGRTSSSNASPGSLVSCRHTTSGTRSSNQGNSRGIRERTEFTFHVATRTRPRYRPTAPVPHGVR